MKFVLIFLFAMFSGAALAAGHCDHHGHDRGGEDSCAKHLATHECGK